MKILISIPYAPTFLPKNATYGQHEVIVAKRSSDWMLHGIRKYWHHVVESFRLIRQARHYDVLVISTVGIEAFMIGRLRWLAPQTKVYVYDLLMPRESRLVRIVGKWLRWLDGYLLIRTGDIQTIQQRFGVLADRCHFVPFPADGSLRNVTTQNGDYIYSSGWAHRDWPTLVAALAMLPYKAIFSTDVSLQIPPHAADRIQILPMQSPEEGRKMMANCGLAVLAFFDTTLPSGPLVLLDAMALGKPVVTSRVNGTRDYAEHEQSALLVPPKDPGVLAEAIDRCMCDDALRRRLGDNARKAVVDLTNEKVVARIIEIVTATAIPDRNKRDPVKTKECVNQKEGFETR